VSGLMVIGLVGLRLSVCGSKVNGLVDNMFQLVLTH
jgi:hypothetical protein